MDIILASKSPRREALLRQVGLAFRVLPAEIDENTDDLKPEDAVRTLSVKKAEKVAQSAGKEAIIISADTIVALGDKIFGKPKSRDEAYAMLTALSGKTHEVYTGVTVTCGGKTRTESVCTKVSFRKLTPDEINGYIQTGEPMDKAGAYGIQEMGALLIDRIEGDYYNVMGLPLVTLSRMLSKFGINLLA